MPNHEIVVIGGSAGSLKPLTAIVAALPADLPAAIFVVQHVRPDFPSALPQIVSDVGTLPAHHAVDGEPIVHGRIYVAPPDYHLMLDRGFARVVRGPRENRYRPAIDVLFRSAARSYGAAVIGVVLSGMLDDGTIGLQAIKQHGGIAIVQDPAEAEYPGMPGSALRYAPIDHALPLTAIAERIVHLASTPVATGAAGSIVVDVEAEIALQAMPSDQLVGSAEAIGRRTPFTCPTCHGTLWQVGDDEPLRYRCHVGHAFTSASLLADQTRELENAFWSAIRLMEEKAGLVRRMAERRRQAGLAVDAEVYDAHAEGIERDVGLLRGLALDGVATDYLEGGAELQEE